MASTGSQVRGVLLGDRFSGDVVQIKRLGLSHVKVGGKIQDQACTWAVEIQEGQEFMADRRLSIHINLEPRQSIGNLRLNWRPTEFGTEAYRKQSYPHPSSTGSRVARGVIAVFVSSGRKMENYMDQIGLQLSTGQARNGKVSGQITLIMPQGGGRVSGRFVASVSDLSASGRP